MEKYNVKIESIGKVTHDVLQIRTDKPQGFSFEPGQATEVSINKEGWQEERRPFTFTCLPTDNFLEFTIKTYPGRKGVTNELLKLNVNDELTLRDVFGTILYQGEGIFIAGGAGVTPFISIFRYLHSTKKLGDNKLIFANKTRKDIILEQDFKKMLNKNFINILSEEKAEGYAFGMISEGFLKSHIQEKNRKFYVCGPPPMMDAILPQLSNLKVKEDSIVTEAF
jgi:ferredoxin-NADP reductase